MDQSSAKGRHYLPTRKSDGGSRKWRRSSRELRSFCPPEACFTPELLSIPAPVLAAQLTLLDLPLYKAIPRKELSACQWSCKLKQKLSPHIVAFIAHFNQICYWMVREVLSVNNMKQRAETIMHIINVADELLELNNINGVKAVMSALTSQPVYRLTETWSHVGKRERSTHTRLSNLLSEEENKIALRCYMETVSRPCIPFLGMYLTDLVFLETCGNRQRMDTIIDDLVMMQLSAYEELQANDSVVEFIQSHRYLDELQMFEEDHHYKMSLALEPEVKRRLSLDEKVLKPPSEFREAMWKMSRQPSLTETRSAGSSAAPSSHDVSVVTDGSGLSRSLSLDKPVAPSKHRRSRSSCDQTDRQDFLFSLSMIHPEVSAGPRHLIDGSLMNSVSSVGSESLATCSSDSSSMTDIAGPEAIQCVGASVQHALSDDDDSETLLRSEMSDGESHSDSPASPQTLSYWIYPSISGMVQVRKLSTKFVECPSSPIPINKSSSPALLPSSTGWLRSWKMASGRVCGNRLGLFPASNSNKKRKSSLAQVQPFCVVDLHCDLMFGQAKSRCIFLSQPGERTVILRMQSEEERDQWLSVLRETVSQCRASAERTEDTATPLIDFDEPC